MNNRKTAFFFKNNVASSNSECGLDVLKGRFKNGLESPPEEYECCARPTRTDKNVTSLSL
jgi:hypothetical protein